MTFLILVMFVLAVSRLTRLVTKDYITDPARIYVMKRFGVESHVAYFLQCPWCISIWISMLVAPFMILATDLPFWTFILAALAASQIVGWLDRFDPEDVDIVITDDA